MIFDRYTAGVYSLLPGGLEALPAFDDKDFKLPSEARTVGCFGVTRTLETESDDSETDSPRHHKNGETAVRYLSEIVNKLSQSGVLVPGYLCAMFPLAE